MLLPPYCFVFNLVCYAFGSQEIEIMAIAYPIHF